MKIGLIRHFKVNHPFPGWGLLSKSEVLNWFSTYDNSHDIDYKKVDLCQIPWQRCYTSPMIRALSTAKHIYSGEIIEITELKELEILHQLSGKIKLPFLVWGMIVRFRSFYPTEESKNFKDGIQRFIDKILAQNPEDILVVSHWFVMRVLRNELIKRGWSGEKFKSDDYGTLYIYEKK